MKFQRNVKSEATIDLAPLIDVVFILLLFFILTTSFTRESTIQINLPEASGDPTTETPLTIEVMVTSAGTYAVNGRALEDNRIETLMAAVTDLAGGDLSLPITITGDAEASYQSAITAMDAVAQLGFTQIKLATRQPEGD
jgi:biopolymer transport protein ExbD